MPEIAEVEIVRRGLNSLKGQTLHEVVSEQRLKISEQKTQVEGERVISLLRHGKLLGLEMSDQKVITCHLRMTGHLSLTPPNKERAHLRFESNTLYFSDTRGFGTMEVVSRDEFASGLGPDLLQMKVGEILLPEKVKRSRRAIKSVILDQSIVAGIGNYMADETLWENKINPTTPAKEITLSQWRKTLQAAQEVARATLAAGGVSIRDYRAPDGTEGTGQEILKAYSRAGLPCVRCGTPLTKSKVGGRGTVWCEVCQ